MIDSSYALSDFLLFSQETYLRLFELYNRDVWPLQILTLGIAGGLIVLMRRAASARAALLLLALVWGWVGWAFHVQRYAAINIAAPYFGALFFLEAVILIAVALKWRPRFATSRAAMAVVLLGAVINPLIGLAAGRSWIDLSLFGLGPDPTAIVTIGVLLACRPRWLALTGAILWCAVSVLTALAMESAEAVGPAAALLAIPLLVIVRRVRGRERKPLSTSRVE